LQPSCRRILNGHFELSASKSQRDIDRIYNGKVYPKSIEKSALTTFVSFVYIGIIPIAPFIFSILGIISKESAIISSLILTFLAFGIIGTAKGLILGEKPVKSAAETILIGGLAAVISYGVGLILGHAIN
jgi:VIT1/CCC1 family predicted Fe2+/Mn2+ transporter